MMKNKKIIISGPPGAGKTTIINELKNKGYNIHHEVNPSKLNKQFNRLKLSSYLFQQRLIQYNKQITTKHLKFHAHKQNGVCFFDRSIIDVIAYMNFWKETYPSEWEITISKYRYNKNIFYTPIWEDIYTKTKERPENYIETKKIDLFLRETFLSFNYNIIEVPKLDVNKRVNFILNNI